MLKALEGLTNINQGSINKPFELASMVLSNSDGQTLIQTLKEDGAVKYYDGYFCIECDGQTMYVDYSQRAINEWMQGYERQANDTIAESKPRILTDEQVARMEKQLDKITENIHYCSANTKEGDYILLENAWVHHKELQNIPYSESSGYFKVLYKSKFRFASKPNFTIHS